MKKYRKSRILPHGIAIISLTVCVIVGLGRYAQDSLLNSDALIVDPQNMNARELPSPLPSTGLKTARLSPKDEMVMLYVPAGNFIMGSDYGDSDEKPAHNLYLDQYWIDRTEITNGMYAQCVQDGVCVAPASSSSSTRDRYYGNLEYDNYPVTYISWDNAKRYCSWREDGSRLPTEAEWEKAARGTDQRIYPWGNTITCAFSNYGECIGDTTPVDSYELGQSAYGVYHLAGNVWEWVGDWYSETYYDVSPAANPLGPNTGEFRVLRGGSWLNYATSVSATNRNWYDPVADGGNLGFRCARNQFP